MKKHILLICLAAMLSYTGMAQVTEFSYQVSFPTGEFHDFIGKTNWAGFSGQYRKILANKRLSIGGSFSWIYMQDKKGHVTHTEDQGTVTGNIASYTNIYPLFLIIQYDLSESKKTIPFIRAGVGGAYQDQRTDAGIYTFQSDGVQFGLNGEIGVRINKDYRKGIVLAFTYHYFPAVNDMVDASFFGVKLGVSTNQW